MADNGQTTRRPDYFEARARELCRAAGTDPDSRVMLPGKPRGMPAWCTFREAAKAEADAAKTAEAAAQIANLRPQDGKYRNSPLTVLGEHDDATIAQMRNCMSVGNVVAGVICADGHLGYAQPVGGVIAYEKQISISGVGYDIGCFTGDTRIYTLDGKHPCLKDVVGKEVWVLSLSNYNVVPKKAFGLKTRLNARLCMVTLDNGKAIRCTADHKFLLRNGVYAEAKDLTSGQSLMPFNYFCDGDGYAMVNQLQPLGAPKQWPARVQTLVLKAGLLEVDPVLCPEGEEIHTHHGDGDIGNNDPSNLYAVGQNTHAKFHASERDWSYKNSEEFAESRRNGIERFWREARQNAEFMEKRRQRSGENWRAYNATNVGVPCPICGDRIVNYRHALSKHPVELRAGTSLRPKGKLVERLVAGSTNHKVVSVEKLDYVEDVYCLHVPGTHNFALLSGVYVHNCGNLAARLDVPFDQIQDRVGPIIQDIARHISFGVGRTNAERVDHALFDDKDAWLESDMAEYRSKAVKQLGTVGSGNHYVDLMRDEQGFVWIGVHFGSRGLGHTSATRYLKAAGGKDGMHVAPAIVDEDSELGARYIAAMELAGRYSYAGREWVVERVRQIIGGSITDLVHNHHNYAWREEHNGRDLWVVRKGATPAFPGQRGFVGGSMGDDAVILEGVDSPEAKAALYSTVHGAGRLHGRNEARRRFRRAEMDEWLRRRGVMLVGADLDESPMAYRRLPDVLAHHTASARVLHRLRPFAVAMAGAGEFDPWKD